LQLRVEQLAVQGQLKAAPAGRLQLEAGDLVLVAAEDTFRQTDGFGFVASGRTVAQVDLHTAPWERVACNGRRITSSSRPYRWPV
jgi:hypothetical protein